MVSGLPVFAKDVLFANEHVVTLMLALFAVGVGAGSMLAERLLHGEVSARHVPMAASAMALFAIDLHLASSGARWRPRPAGRRRRSWPDRGSWRVLVDLLGLAVAGGLFTVPLYALLQHESEPAHRARVIAANNIINALAMTVAAVVAAALLGARSDDGRALRAVRRRDVAGGDRGGVGPAAGAGEERRCGRCCGSSIASRCRASSTCARRCRKRSSPPTTRRFSTACCSARSCRATRSSRSIRSSRSSGGRGRSSSFVNALPVDPTNPLSIRAMIRAVEGGSPCIIFPEGRITTTGSLMKVYEGPAVIAERTQGRAGAGAHRGRRAHAVLAAGRQGAPAAGFRKVRIRVLPPRRLTAPEGVTGRARRAALRRALARRDGASRCSRRRGIDTTLFDALLEARELHGGGHVIADDLDQQPMSYSELVTASFALGARAGRAHARRASASACCCRRRAPRSSPSSPCRPTGRVPAMLNFSTGAAVGAGRLPGARRSRSSSRRAASSRRPSSSRWSTALEAQATIVYLEDLRGEIGVGREARARWCARCCAAAPPDRERADDPAVVLFTSGSEGTPKGVVLSHRNLLANRHQLASVVDFSPKDLVLNALPVFHSFGLTGGLLLPLLAGVRTFLYPSPLHYRTVPELAYGINATILFGTDTFLAGYARVADNYDFYSVRYVFAGAERVKAETRRVWFEKFGIRILEGYGATETAPALAVNTPMHFSAGTVGRLLPGIEHRLEPVRGHRPTAGGSSSAART